MPNKGDTIIARLARGAVTTTVISGALMNAAEIASGDSNIRSAGSSSIIETISSPSADHALATDSFEFECPQSLDEWTKDLEKEFRALALNEVKGTLKGEDFERLNLLNYWRDTLSVQRKPDEILIQMQRDRVVDKLSEALEEYVQFHKSSRSASGVS